MTTKRPLITTINLSFTTFCNMRCPDCCCDITAKPNSEKTFYDWEYFKHLAQYLQGMPRIHLTGGEPTIHPQFQEFIPKFKELFNCQNLTLESNGWGFTRFPEIFEHFDIIYISHYTDKSWCGSPDNTAQIDFLRNYYLDKPKPHLHVGEIIHLSRNTRGSKMCYRGYSDNVAICDGLVFPCCVGPGVYPRNAIMIGPHWREEILSVQPPCENCFFADK